MNINFNQKLFFSGIFFLLGASFLKASFIFFIAAFVGLVLFSRKKYSVSCDVVIYSFLCIFGAVLPILFGGIHGNFTGESLYKSFFVLSFVLMFYTYALSLFDLNSEEFIIISFIFGLYFEAICVVFYSFYFGYNGYGDLYNPFSSQKENSPMYSNNAAIVAVLCMVKILFERNKLFYKILYSIVFVTSFFMGVYLGGRTYFYLIFIIFILMILFSDYKDFKCFLLASVLMLFFSCYLIFLSQDFNLEEKFYVWSRLSNGLESARIRIYIDGLIKTIENPFGGFYVDALIDDVPWFHNIFIDIARLGGWFPLLIIFVLFFYSFLQMFWDAKKNGFKLIHALFISTFILMMQDVILEANYKIFFLNIFCCIYFSRRLALSRSCCTP